MHRIVVFGSLNIDTVYSVDHIVRPGETISSYSVMKNPGGKGLNQASAIARTGLPVFMAGKIGKDGEMLCSVLSSFSVDTSLISVDQNGATGNAMIQVSKEGENSIVLFSGTNGMIDEEYIDYVLSHFDEGDVLVLQNEINMLSSIIGKARARGMYIVFNPAPFDSSVLSLPLSSVDLLVVNEIEGAGLSSVESLDHKAVMEELERRFGESEIIMTMGKEGAMYCGKGERHYVPAKAVEAVDTTAAGDTFIGYYIASREKGFIVPEALEYATKASAITVSRKGAAISVPEGWEVYGK